MMPSAEVLTMIITFTVVLLAMAVVFSLIVVYLHVRNERRARRLSEVEGRWETPLLNSLTEGPGAFDSARLVRSGEATHFLWFLVRFARRLRGTERAVLTQLASPYVPKIREQLRRGTPEVRARAVQILVSLGMPEHADAVIRALDDPSPLVAVTAARGLSRPEHAAHASEVLRRVDRFSGWSQRYLASMLASIGEPAVPTLRQILSDRDAPAESRAIAAEALTSLRDLASAGECVRILGEEPDRELLAAVVGLLAVVGTGEHLPAVLPLLDSPEPWVRSQALETVARLGSREDVPVLRRAVFDPSPWVALRAAYGLFEIGAVEELQRLAADESGNAAELAREVLSRAAA